MSSRRFDYETTDSTSNRAFESLARGAARHGDLHVARAQTAGRGTRGRTWFSPPGEGLYFSLVWLPPPPTLSPAALTMAAGLAVIDGCRSVGLEHASLKWPNDVVVGGAKLAGVLVETRGLEADRPHYVVGVGLNVRQRSFPADLLAQRSVTSLYQCGVDCTVEQVLAASLPSLEQRLLEAARDHERLERDFLDAIGLSGREVLVRVGERELSGTLLALSLSTGLKLGAHAAPREQWLPIEPEQWLPIESEQSLSIEPERSLPSESEQSLQFASKQTLPSASEHVLPLENVRELRLRTLPRSG